MFVAKNNGVNHVDHSLQLLQLSFILYLHDCILRVWALFKVNQDLRCWSRLTWNSLLCAEQWSINSSTLIVSNRESKSDPNAQTLPTLNSGNTTLTITQNILQIVLTILKWPPFLKYVNFGRFTRLFESFAILFINNCYCSLTTVILQVNLCNEKLCARTWHTTAAYTISENCSELLVFGGSPDNIWQPKHKYWANMVRFNYGKRSHICLGANSNIVALVP